MKTQRFTSLATSPGIAIGKAHRIRHAGRSNFTRTWIRDIDVDGETERFRQAVHLSKERLARIQSKMCRIDGHEQIKIIESYRLFLQDDMLVQTTIDHINSFKINAEWALDKTLAHLRLSFLNVNEDYLRERSQDIDYVGRCIMGYLLGQTEISPTDITENGIILIAHDFSPAEIASFPKERVLGFVMEVGGETSHTAIIARSLEIPAVFGVKDIVSSVKNGETVILDGMKGLVILSPNRKELAQYHDIHRRYVDLERMLLKDVSLPAETQDGHRVDLYANIELVEEVPSLLQHGADGVGLYRTEYLFLDRIDEPSEDEQVENYTRVLKELAPRPVTIRTIDLGADKLSFVSHLKDQANPALGLRGIRLSLKQPTMFKQQLRALLRASVHGALKIMLPMITDLGEVRKTKEIIASIRESLAKDKIPVKEDIPLGIMVEVPATVLVAESLAREVDFFSIGTNDLIQYGLAIDRANELVNELYTPFHPAVLRMILLTVEAAKKASIPVSVCGEMAGDPLTIILLVGMGLDALSMNPVSLPRVKKILRSLTFTQSQRILGQALECATSSEVEALIRQEVVHILPPQLRQLERFFTGH